LIFSRDADTRSSGLIINTSGWVDQEGFGVLLHAIQVVEKCVVKEIMVVITVC
jgi:polynucleotide 5'-kinase involved in rRNA processing